MKTKDKLEILIKLIPYVIPKQLETTNYNETDLDIEISEEEKNALLDTWRRMLE